MNKRFPMPIPFGWFFVGWSDELRPGDVRSLRYFDRDLVLFRGEDGAAGLLNAHCLHMGAHLGEGGRVEGNSVVCPFHGWQFNRKGRCTDIPYGKTIPPKLKDGRVCQRPWPVVEKNQVIWAWYHPTGREPAFDVMEHEEIGHPDWTPTERYMWSFSSNPQEIAENGVDVAHFQFVHGMPGLPEGKTVYDGIQRISEVAGHGRKVRIVQHGAGQKYTRFSGTVDTMLMVLVTPVTDEQVELRFAFTHKKYPEDSAEYAAAREKIESVTGEHGVLPDIPIWEHKIHHVHPLLCDGDGPIMALRRYFSQFYYEQQGGGREGAGEPASVREVPV